MDDGYVYPRIKFVGSVTLKQQVEKAESELFEAHQLLGRKNVNLSKFAEEIEDVIQALESVRRNLQENHQVFVNQIRRKVVLKCRRKGYYDVH